MRSRCGFASLCLLTHGVGVGGPICSQRKLKVAHRYQERGPGEEGRYRGEDSAVEVNIT